MKYLKIDQLKAGATTATKVVIITNENENVLIDKGVTLTENHLQNLRIRQVPYIYIEGEATSEEMLNEAIDTVRGIIIERSDEEHFIHSIEYISNHTEQSGAISSLIETCRTINDYTRKTIILKALGKLKAVEAVNILLTTVKLGSTEHKIISLEALSNISAIDSIKPLAFLYFSQTDSLKNSIFDCFSKMDKNIVKDVLFNIVKTDEKIEIRKSALYLLNKLDILDDVEYSVLEKRYTNEFSEKFISQPSPQKVFRDFDSKNLSLDVEKFKNIVFEKNREIKYERDIVNFSNEEKNTDYMTTYYNLIDYLLLSVQTLIQGKQINFKALKLIASTLDELAEKDLRKLLKLASNNSLDNYLIVHMMNVAVFAAGWVKSKGFSDHKRIEFILSSLLYDVGMAIVPKLIWTNKGILPEMSKPHLLLHPLIGVNCLEKSHYLSHNIIMSCLQHHENITGGGYPKKISGDEITEFARMIRIIDSFEAITKSRTYRSNSSFFETLRTMRSEVGKFDEKLMADFVSFIYSSNIYDNEEAFKNILFSIGNKDIKNIINDDMRIMDTGTDRKKLKILVGHAHPDAVAIDLETVEKAHRIDLVNFISDIVSPDKILVLTSSTYKEEILNFHRVGIKNILRKPCEVDSIITRTKEIMRR